METYLKGNFRKTIYRNDSGYVIGIFKVKETNDDSLLDYVNRTITYTGYFHEQNEEDTYMLYGKMVTHDRYGEQFQVDSYERLMPEEKDGIVEFLSSNIFKGIGEKKAQKIVEMLGEDALKIILENPDNLLLVPTVTKKQADLLHQKLVEYEASYTTIVALHELGFSTKDSLLIYHKYKEKTGDMLDQNIYQVAQDLEDISFKKVDSIALKHDMKPDDARRIAAAILYCMEEICNAYGHSYLLSGEIYQYTLRILGVQVGDQDFETALKSLLLDLKVIELDEKYYLKEMYEAEQNIATRCSYLSKLPDQESSKLEENLENLEEYFRIEYNDDQKEAIRKSFQKRFLIITGGPGTGKTTIIKAITELYRQMEDLSYEDLAKEIALLAPTGRASKRISESTLLPALTIHRFLKWNKENNSFAINEHNRSDAKFVIIDEMSMVDTYLLDHLLKGLSPNTKIILVGDHHQLPSVGPGQVLKDMIESGTLCVVKLNQLYRQGEDSNILTLAYDINANRLDRSVFNQEEDLAFFPCPPMKVKEKIMELCEQYKEGDYKKLQILAPLYKTINGIDELNIALQSIFNPPTSKKKEILINDVIFREKDKVIQLSNMPDENVFNGDIGVIEKIENGTKKQIVINFDGNKVRYTAANFGKFKHGYAISIHKSQGSEFDMVLMPMVKGYGKMLYRKLVYTGVTRTKKKLILLGDIDALELAIHNDQSGIRRTSLKEVLISRLTD